MLQRAKPVSVNDRPIGSTRRTGMDGQSETCVQLDIPEVALEDLEENPHAVFRKYRPQVPLIRRPDGVYLLLRAADMPILREEGRTRRMETEYPASQGITSGRIWDIFSNSLMTSNDGVHQKRRGPVSRTLEARMVAGLRSTIRQTANTLLDSHEMQRGFDLRNDFAALVPAMTIAGILGLPYRDIPEFTEQVYKAAKIVSGAWSKADLPEIENACAKLLDYAMGLVESRRRDPGDDFISSYLAEVDEATDFSPLEIIVQLFALIVSGSDTVRAAIVIQTSLLLQHRSQWKWLRNNLDGIPDAVAEAMRYEPTIGSVTRVTLDDITLDGHVLPRGSIVSLMLASILRDPNACEEPDRFDIRRKPMAAHPAFGGGSHRCLGETLAKIEMEEALRALLIRYPRLAVDGDYPDIMGHAGIRRVANMPVRFY
jgi:cytochrome P450 family 103